MPVIECKLRRLNGTRVILGSTTYLFSPNKYGNHVSDVTNPAHVKRFLSIPEGYSLYNAPEEEEDEDTDAPVQVQTKGRKGKASKPQTATEEADTAPAQDGKAADTAPAQDGKAADTAPAQDGKAADTAPAQDGKAADTAPAQDGKAADTAPAQDGKAADKAADLALARADYFNAVGKAADDNLTVAEIRAEIAAKTTKK